MKVLLTLAAITLGSWFAGDAAQARSCRPVHSYGRGQRYVVVQVPQRHRGGQYRSHYRRPGRDFYGRRQEYRRRGKSPSGVIDGEYNDDYLEDDEIYNEANRDWEVDA